MNDSRFLSTAPCLFFFVPPCLRPTITSGRWAGRRGLLTAARILPRIPATMAGRKIVLAASDSESSEYLRSNWRQMLLASLPARLTRFPFYMTDISLTNEVGPDGQARYVPHGLRI